MDIAKRENVAVLFGGRSSEHEISVITGLQAIQAIDPYRYNIFPIYVAPNGHWYAGKALLDKKFYRNWSDNLNKVEEVTLLPHPGHKCFSSVGKASTEIPVDICFLAFHGQYGEDGCVQGLLELTDIPYTGCGVAASAVAMNKYQCKIIVEAHGIPVLPAITVSRQEAISDLTALRKKIKSTLGLTTYPLFVKPCHLGSSVGVSSAHDDQSLNAALAKAFRYDDEAIIEPCLSNLMEINIAVLDGTPPIASVVEIPIATSGGTLTYADKYLRNATKSSESRTEGMASLSRIIDPVDLPKEIKQEVTRHALKAYTLLKCSGISRFDFMFDKDKGQLYFNELNPIPGSLAFYLLEKTDPVLLYTEVLHRMLQRAKELKFQKLALDRNIIFKALR